MVLCLQNDFCIFPHPQAMNYCYIAKVYLLQYIITNCFSSKLLPVAMYGITRPNFMNNVDVLILFLIAWDVIMHNKSLFTKKIYIHFFDINTAVTCSTHGADT